MTFQTPSVTPVTLYVSSEEYWFVGEAAARPLCPGCPEPATEWERRQTDRTKPEQLPGPQ